VFVRNAVSGGSSQEFKVKASQRVHDLQGLVGLASLRSAEDVRLLWNDEILEEWQSLEAAGVSDGAKLTYVLLNVEPDREFEEMITRIMDEELEDEECEPRVFDKPPSVLDLEAKCGASFPESLKTYLRLTNVVMRVCDPCWNTCVAASGVLYIGEAEHGACWFVDLNNTLGEGASSIWHGQPLNGLPPMDFWVGNKQCGLVATDIKDRLSKFFEAGRRWPCRMGDPSDSEDDFNGECDLADFDF